MSENREVWIGPAQMGVAEDQVPAAHTGTPGMNQARRVRLPRGLIQELYQTESSARRHGARQSARLGASPPGRALEVISRHAAATLRVLPDLTGPRRLPRGRIGRMVGSSFSLVRRLLDPMLGQERSYRVTLLGLHHGVDTVRAMRNHAIDAGDDQLAHWCDAWLDTRLRLLQNAELGLLWFGRVEGGTTHPA